MSKYIVDASAILALMFGENGKDDVEKVLPDSIASRVNVTEVLTKLIEKGSPLSEAWTSILDLELNIVEFDETQSLKTAELVLLTRHLGLSFGDRACLALAIQEQAVAVTADRS